MFKRTIALLVAMELLWTAPGLAAYEAFAQGLLGPMPALPPVAQTVGALDTLRQLEAKGLPKPDDESALIQALETDSTPNVAGRLLVTYGNLLNAQGAIDKEFSKSSLEKVGRLLQQLGAKPSDSVAERRKAELKELDAWVGRSNLNDKDLYSVGTALVIVLTRLAEPPGGALTDKVAVEEQDGLLVATDRKTAELYRKEDLQGHIVYSKEVMDRQQRYNQLIQDGKVDAPLVPATGKMNFPTLMFPYYELQNKVTKFRQLVNQSELASLLQITNQANKYRPDQLTDPRLQPKLVAELMDYTMPDGRKASYYLSPSFKARRYYLDEAQHYVDEFKKSVDALKDAQSYPNDVIQKIEELQRNAQTNISLAFIEGNVNFFDQQTNTMKDPDADKVIKDAPVDEAKKKAYADQKDKLLDRMAQLRRMYTGLQDTLGQRPDLAARKRAEALIAGGADLSDAVEQAPKDISRDFAMAQGTLNESQGYSRDLQIAVNAYSTTASLLKATYDTNGDNDAHLGKGFLWTGLSFKHGTDKAAEWLNDKFGWFGGYTSDVRQIRANEIALTTAFDHIGQGNYKLAMGQLMHLTDDQDVSKRLVVDTGESPSDLAIMQASIEGYQARLKSVQDVHFWADYGGNIVATSLMAGALAPVARGFASIGEAGLTKVSNTMKSVATGIEETEALQVGGLRIAKLATYPLIRLPAWGFYAGGRVADNMARGLESLNNAEHVPGFVQKGLNIIPNRTAYWAAVRTYNMFQREMVASATLGAISGGMEVGRYEMNPDKSHYRSAGEAFKTGAKFGADFAVKPENLPWLFGGGLPSDVFGLESRLGRAWFNYGNQGLVGGTLETMGFEAGKGMASLSKMGKLGFGTSFVLGMGDQMLKYYAGAAAIGWAAERGYVAYEEHKNEDSDKLLSPDQLKLVQLKRAEKSEKFGADVMQQAWRFMPVASAKFGSAEEFYAAEHGAKQYEEAGLRYKLANSASGAELPYLRPPEMPGFQRFFLRGTQTRTAKVRTFRASDDMVLESIRKELGEKTGGDASKLLEVTRMEDEAVLGDNPEKGLRIRREVRAEAWEMYKDAIRKKPSLATEAMRNGSQGLKEEAALAVLQNASEGNVLRRAASKFKPSDSAQLKEAEKVLEPFIKSERGVNEAGEALVKATKAIKTPSAGLKEAVKQFRDDVSAWKAEAQASGNKSPSYKGLLEKWQDRISELRGQKKVSAAEAEALSKAVDYIRKFQDRLDQRKVDGKTLIQDAQGNQIPSLRPDQFERVVEYLSNMLERGKGPSKTFLELATGGGKTLLVFEALLPVVLAEAKLGPKPMFGGAPKVVFITSSTGLQSQARTDFKAFKKILSDIEIMTGEQFKTKLAEGKMLGKTKPEDFWVIADEFDGLALQPALTIGRETHVATREHPSFRRAQTVVEELETLAGSDLKTADKAAGVRRLQTELHQALLDAKVLNKTAASKLKSDFARMGDEAVRGSGPEAAKRVSDLAESYNWTLKKAIAQENPLYEAYRTMKEQDATRFADSELLYKGPERYRNRQRLESIGREAVEAAKKGDGAAASELVGEAERLLSKDSNGNYDKVQAEPGQGAKLEQMAEGLAKLREVAERRAHAEPAKIELMGRRYQELLEAGVKDMDVKAAFERSLTTRTRARAWDLLKAFWNEPTMDGITRTRFMLKALYSALTGQGWVRQEILNLIQGRLEGDANVRADNITGKIHPIHNGEFVPTMDTPTRRYFELENGRDLTLPYEHEVLTTVNDIIESKAGQLGVSGTQPQPFRAKLDQNGYSNLGKGTPINPVESIVKENPTDAMNTAINRVKSGLQDAPEVGKAIEARVDRSRIGALKSELASAETPVQMNRALNRAGISNPAELADALPQGRDVDLLASAKAWAEHGGRDLEVIGVANTRELKWIEKALKRQGIRQDQISKLFSDAEYLGANYPKAKIKQQMNLQALGTGKAKVLLVDMRVGGRGLDLPFKKGGYKNVEILIKDPHSISAVHNVQFQGRTAPNRLVDGATRSYYYLIDLKAAGKNATLKRMAEARGLSMVDSSIAGNQEFLKIVQQSIEQNQLRQSQVSKDAPAAGDNELPIR
jgi:hypothetical protein